MAILSNINGKFAVESTGAIQFNGSNGTAGYILKSNGNASPTWVAASTVIGGPYLPLSGGILTGATSTSSGISFTVGGILTTQSSSSGDYVRLYGSSGTAQWDIYGNGENLRLSENSGGGGVLAVDSGATFGGGIEVNQYIRNTTSNTNSNYIQRDSANTALYVQQRGAGNIVQFQYGAGAIGSATDALTISGTGAATFAGDVKIAEASNKGQLFFGTANTDYEIKGGGNYGYLSLNAPYLRFDTGGTQRMRIDSVGDVQARRARSNTAGEVALSLQPTDTVAHYGWRIDQTSNNLNLDYVNTPLNIMSYSTTGNVGIGQTPYSYARLLTEGSDNTSSNYAFIAYNQNTDAILACRNDGQVTMPSGNVGIGMTSPSYLLHVDDAVATDPSYIVASSGSDFIMAMGSQSSPGVAQEAFIGTLSNQRFKLKVNNAEIATLTSGGLGIGMTTPTASLGIQANYTANGSYTTDGWARYLVLDAANTGGGGIIWTKQSSTYNRAILNNQGKMEFGRSTANDASAAWLSDLSIDAVGDSTFGGNIFIASTSDGIFLGGTSTSNVLKKFVGNQAGGGAGWTPTVTTSQLTNPTITSSSGYYQQIGNVVTASFEFTMSNPAVGAGAVIINNLPIAIADTDHVSGCGVISALGKTINVFHYTATNQIAMYTYDGNYCGTTHRTVGTVTYWAAT